jgi:hypothetical protein
VVLLLKRALVSWSLAMDEPAISGKPQTPEGVPEDVLEESEEEPGMASELVPKVVPEEVPAEGK